MWIQYSPSISQLHSIVWLRYLQLCLSWSMQWICSLPSFLPPRILHHCLDGWFAVTGCGEFHLCTSCVHSAISSARTHNHFSHSFCLSKYFHLPVYISGLLLPPPRITWIPPNYPPVWCLVYQCLECHVHLRCKLRLSWVDYPLCSLQVLLHLVLTVDKSPRYGQFLCLGRFLSTQHPVWRHHTALSWFRL